MSEPHRVFMLAGEPSGDRIGADFLRRMKARKALEPIGVGGPEMASEGLTSIFPMSDLSVMGFADVIKRLPLLLWRIRQSARFIIRQHPEMVVLIDSQVFSALLARQLRKAGYERPIVLYVAPSVWAWKPERAPKLKPLFNEILAVLPFEPAALERLEGPLTTYVGHPAIDAIPTPLALPTGAGKVALLPGSRGGEIRRHLPILAQLVARLADHPKVSGFILPTLPHLAAELRAETANWAGAVEIIDDRAKRDDALRTCRAAVVTAGTVTLELALSGIPMIGTYMPDKRLMHHYEKAGRPMIALPNIILGRAVVPEIAPGDDLVARLYAGTISVLEDEAVRGAQLSAFAELRALMQHGAPETPRQDPADRILAYLR